MNCNCDKDATGWYPVLPFWGWTAYTPVIPTLYYECISPEQANLNLWKCFDKLSHYADYLAENINKYAPTELEERITVLEGDVTDINERIDTIEVPAYNPYAGKNIVFIGDSYTYGTGASDHLIGDTKRYSSLLNTWLGGTELNFAVGGTGFCYGGQNNKTFNQQLLDAISTLTNEEKNNTNLVIIAGGINDTRVNNYSYTDMYTTVNTTINTAYSGFPNAKILVVPMLYQGYQFTKKANVLNDAIVNATRKSNKRNVFVMEGCYTWNWGDRNHYADDKLHPNDLGHQTIATHLLHGVFGDLVQYENYEYTAQFATGYGPAQSESSSTQVDCSIVIHNGIVSIKPFRIMPEVAISGNTLIGSIPASCAPEHNVYVQLNRGNNNIGCAAFAFNNNIYVNPNLDENGIPANLSFYISPISYPLYGSDYQN